MKTQTSYKNFLLLFFCLGLLSSCSSSFDLAHLHVSKSQSKLLPRLYVELDAPSFASLYPSQFVESEQYYEDGSVGYVSSPRQREKYMDVQTLTHRMMENNICDNFGEYYGIARLKVISRDVSFGGHGFLLASILSCFTLNIVGLPYGRVQAVMELEMDILDSKGRLLKSYIGQGKVGQAQGFYYGSGSPSRTVHAMAIKEVLSDIRRQIEQDKEVLKQTLWDIGPAR